jgi:glucan phosphoethanolaminetransferase (alkaline phosphatase superfamily)
VKRPELSWRTFGFVAALVFATQFAVMDLVFRGSAALGARPRIVVNELETIALWVVLLALATTRARRTLVALAAAALLVVQANVFRYYHVPLDVQVAASAIHAWADVRAVLTRALPMVVVSIAIVFALESALLEAFHRSVRPLAPPPLALGFAALGGLFGLAPREATPDVRAVHALSALHDRREPRAASAVSIPLLHADRAELPSVLFILSESIRAEDYTPETAPETFAATPGRVDLVELRSVASYTALSLSAVLTGRSQEGPRDDILRAPTLFDFARAARDARGRRPTVAYFSAQSEEVFETKEMRAAIDRFASIESFAANEDEANELGDRGADRLAVERTESELPSLATPSLVFLHLIDTHAPYVVDPEHAPFKPYGHSPAWSEMKELHNAYKNAIHLQDRLVARVVRRFVAAREGHPWLVVFTSDHGDAFSEHGAIHHGQNLFDEQVHVPAWIFAGPGTLTPPMARALEDHRARFLTHLDLLPTVLDAMGLWDNFAVGRFRAGMGGKSMLRPWESRGTIPVTNCTGMFQCPMNTWGLYLDDHKLVARIYDGSWSCFLLGQGPERHIGDATCERLRAESRVTFPFLPNGAPNR